VGSSGSNIRYLTNINGMLYFQADNGTNGRELWFSDGTAAGTMLVKDFTGDSGDSAPLRMIEVAGKLFVVATTEAFGEELWVADVARALPGDYDSDADVDGADFLSWQRGLVSSVSPAGSGADGDGSGVVDAGDLDVWMDGFGAALGAKPQAAMEAVAVSNAQPEAPVKADIHRDARAAIFAAGDFTSLFGARDEWRPLKRRALRR